MKIINIIPLYTEFHSGLGITKNDDFQLVAEINVTDGYSTDKAVIKFDMLANREGMSYRGQSLGDLQGIYKLFESKLAKNVCKTAMRDLPTCHPCYENLNVYVNFDKVLKQQKGA